MHVCVCVCIVLRLVKNKEYTYLRSFHIMRNKISNTRIKEDNLFSFCSELLPVSLLNSYSLVNNAEPKVW